MAVLSLTEAKAYLRMSGSADDGQLEATIANAEAVIAARIGPLEPTSTTRRVRPNGSTLLLDPPALSLTTILDDGGNALDLSDLYLDPETGVVTFDNDADFGSRWYTVTYLRGFAAGACPPDLVEAVRVLVKHLWTPRRGTAARPGASTSDGPSDSIPGAGYLLPFRVEQLLAPYMPTGIA